jgi:hypothetical protein
MSLSINPQEREHQREWSISIQAFALLLFAIWRPSAFQLSVIFACSAFISAKLIL